MYLKTVSTSIWYNLGFPRILRNQETISNLNKRIIEYEFQHAKLVESEADLEKKLKKATEELQQVTKKANERDQIIAQQYVHVLLILTRYQAL